MHVLFGAIAQMARQWEQMAPGHGNAGKLLCVIYWLTSRRQNGESRHRSTCGDKGTCVNKNVHTEGEDAPSTPEDKAWLSAIIHSRENERKEAKDAHAVVDFSERRRGRCPALKPPPLLLEAQKKIRHLRNPVCKCRRGGAACYVGELVFARPLTMGFLIVVRWCWGLTFGRTLTRSRRIRS